MGSTEVFILGQKYTLRGDAPEEYIRELASYVDTKLKEVYKGTPNITPVKASILAAIDIADELFKIKNRQDELTSNIEKKAATLASLFDINVTGVCQPSLKYARVFFGNRYRISAWYLCRDFMSLCPCLQASIPRAAATAAAKVVMYGILYLIADLRI